jgi:hypothetical protein
MNNYETLTDELKHEFYKNLQNRNIVWRLSTYDYEIMIEKEKEEEVIFLQGTEELVVETYWYGHVSNIRKLEYSMTFTQKYLSSNGIETFALPFGTVVCSTNTELYQKISMAKYIPNAFFGRFTVNVFAEWDEYSSDLSLTLMENGINHGRYTLFSVAY